MSAKNYNLKEAYNKALTGKARLHYLENYEHDSRRGYAGEYSGNHPKYSKGVAMAGNPMSPMKELDADLEFMPVEDIAGQGTEGVNMKTNPINNIKPFKDPGAPKGFKSDAGDFDAVVDAPSYETLEKKIKRGAESYKDQGRHIQSASVSNEMRDVAYGSNTNTQNLPKNERRKLEQSLSGSQQGDTISKYERLKALRQNRLNSISMMKSPMKEQKYGGNKGDESRSRRDFAGPSMMKSPMKVKLNTKYTSMRDRVKRDRR
jgi:hypothetical protein